MTSRCNCPNLNQIGIRCAVVKFLEPRAPEKRLRGCEVQVKPATLIGNPGQAGTD